MLRTVVLCLVVVGLVTPAAVVSATAPVVSSGESGGGGDVELALAVTSTNDAPTFWGKIGKWLLGKYINWQVKMMRQPGYFDPPEPPGSWWPGRV